MPRIRTLDAAIPILCGCITAIVGIVSFDLDQWQYWVLTTSGAFTAGWFFDDYLKSIRS